MVRKDRAHGFVCDPWLGTVDVGMKRNRTERKDIERSRKVYYLQRCIPGEYITFNDISSFAKLSTNLFERHPLFMLAAL